MELLSRHKKYLYVSSPILVLVSLFNFYPRKELDLLSVVTLVAGLIIGLFFFIQFYNEVLKKVMGHRVSLGINALLFTVVLLGIVVILYLFLMDRNKRFDLTRAKRFTLSDQTAKVLERLDGPINAYAIYAKQMNSSSITELLDQYKYKYRDFNIEFIDPVLNPAKVEELGVTGFGQVIIEYDGKTKRVKSNTEEGVTDTLRNLMQTEVKEIYFISGHGEKSLTDNGSTGYSQMKRAIEAENYKVEDLLLLKAERIPEDAATVVVAGPKNDYHPYEIGLLNDFVECGGRLFFLLDPDGGCNQLANIAAFLKRYGLLLGNDVVIDPLSRALFGDSFTLFVDNYTYNPITENLKSATFFRLVRSVSPDDVSGEGMSSRVVASTGDASWQETDFEGIKAGKANFDKGADIEGPASIMAYTTVSRASASSEVEVQFDKRKPEEAIIVLAGDSDFITNAMLQTQGNRDLFLNTINFLAASGEPISIRSKQQGLVYLALTAFQGRVAFFISQILMPLTIAWVGIFVEIRRR